MSLCLTAALLSFQAHNGGVPLRDVSASYRRYWQSDRLPRALQECETLIRISEQRELEVSNRIAVDILWVLSIAITETGLNNDLVSSAGARSSMQTYRRYSPCGDCDLRLAGIIHASRLLGKHGMCDGAAKYNGGPAASCSGNSPSKKYAHKVIGIYAELCEALDAECNLC